MRKFLRWIFLLCGLYLVAACQPPSTMFPSPVQSAPVQHNALLTREDAITHASATLADAEILDARLLYHEEAYRELGLGMINYRNSSIQRDDPVWVILVQSPDVAGMPMASEIHNTVLLVIHAADINAGSSMSMMTNAQAEEQLRVLQSLPDRTAELSITPHEARAPAREPSLLAELPVGPILSREEAVQRATFGVATAEVLDVRLVRHGDALRELDLGIIEDIAARGVATDTYEFMDMYTWRYIEMDHPTALNMDDPAWVATLTGADLSQFPFAWDNTFSGLIVVASAADGLRSRMVAIVDPETDKAVQRIQMLPDWDGQLEIDPRDPPTPYPTPIPGATPTPIPGVIQATSPLEQ